MSLSVAEQLLYSTVKLTSWRGGVQAGTGTGFFMHFAITAERRAPCIVTNKHVIEDCDRITAMCHLDDGNKPSGRFIECRVDLEPAGLVLHPDTDTDLCAIPFASILNSATAAGTPLFSIYTGLENIPADDEWEHFDAIEDVTMVGCPNGISDEVNNLPIVRRGITATSIGKHYNGKPEFLVDMACFPGSSGSPIFVYDRSGYMDRKQNTYMMGASRLKLVGILYAGPQITNTGKIILATPPKFEVATMMHLGIAVRASELRKLDEELTRRMTDDQVRLPTPKPPARHFPS